MVSNIGSSNSAQTQTINNNLDKEKTEESKALDRIAATRAISGEDTANLLIADSLVNQISTLGQGVQNANEAVGMLQIADAALTNVSESADRLNELSIAYNSAALNSEQKAILQGEATRLTESMSQSINNASYNGKPVFDGNLEFVTGNESVSASLIAPSTDGLDITSQESIETFMDSVNSVRSNIGAAVNEMDSLVQNHLNAITNLTESESKLQNNDLAENYNDLNAAKLRENAGLYAASFNTAYLQLKVNALLA